MESNLKREEIQIPVPHGHLAAISWKNYSSNDVTQDGTTPVNAKIKRVLALHGWMDNANSFHKLAPHLLKKITNPLHLVCLEFSGHGKSSHIGAGGIYDLMVFLIDVKRAIEFLEWDRKDGAGFYLLGHSMGAFVAMSYAAIFGGTVEKMASLDVIAATEPENLVVPGLRKDPDISECLEMYAKLELKELEASRSPHLFLIEEMEKKFMAALSAIKDEDSKRLLLERSIEISKDCPGYCKLISDHRIKMCNSMQSLMRSSTCVRELLARNYVGRHFVAVTGADSSIKFSEEAVEGTLGVLKENCATFEVVRIENAGHHVHMDQPEAVADVLVTFFNL